VKNKFPKELILKQNEYDFLGIKLELVKVTEGRYEKAYYAKCDGNCSKIDYISFLMLRDIENGKHPYLFKNIDDLHSVVERAAKSNLECIERYRKTGEYFERRSTP